jgi:DNA polymerase sigma
MTLEPYAAHRQAIWDDISLIKNEAFASESHLDKIHVELFGSLAQGLAIESSDMDLVVTGLSCFNDKETERQHLLSLSGKMREKFSPSLLTNLEEIVDTDFPVLKLTFDI